MWRLLSILILCFIAAGCDNSISNQTGPEVTEISDDGQFQLDLKLNPGAVVESTLTYKGGRILTTLKCVYLI